MPFRRLLLRLRDRLESSPLPRTDPVWLDLNLELAVAIGVATNEEIRASERRRTTLH